MCVREGKKKREKGWGGTETVADRQRRPMAVPTKSIPMLSFLVLYVHNLILEPVTVTTSSLKSLASKSLHSLYLRYLNPRPSTLAPRIL
jgi:hypothetical protein